MNTSCEVRTTVFMWDKPGFDHVAAQTVEDTNIHDRISPDDCHAYLCADRADYRVILSREQAR